MTVDRPCWRLNSPLPRPGLTARFPKAPTARRWAAWLAPLALLASSPAQARTSAVPPARPVPASFYSGIWYELARTPNAREKLCAEASDAFLSVGGSGFSLVQTCRQGSVTGPAKVTRARGAIVAGTQNEKFSISFLGGLVRQQFWVLDYASDGAWAIMATPGGNYVWLFSRSRDLPAPVLAAAVNRVRALGYSRLEFPSAKQP